MNQDKTDEKMNTEFESFVLPQNTDISILASNCYDEDHKLELKSNSLPPKSSDNIIPNDQKSGEDNYLMMDNSKIDNSLLPKIDSSSPVVSYKLVPTLTSTPNHPLMNVESPQKNYPDVVPKNIQKTLDDLSFWRTSDDTSNSKTKNTSKNNLYDSDHYVTAETSHIEELSSKNPDVASVSLPNISRRKIIPIVLTDASPVSDTSASNCTLGDSDDAISCHNTENVQRINRFSYSQKHRCAADQIKILAKGEFSPVVDWCDSPSQFRSMPNFDLPIEMSASITTPKNKESPDVVSSSSTQEDDHSAYEAVLDPYTGNVALRPKHGQRASSAGQMRRKIQLPPDHCSMESDNSIGSLESDEERQELPNTAKEMIGAVENTLKSAEETICVVDTEGQRSDGKLTKRSSNMNGSSSEPISEYSAAEELHQERSWRTVAPNCTVDMKKIEPFKRVLSHGGYDTSGSAIVVFSACHLPESTITDYHCIMNNLFLYIMWTLNRLITDEYIVVYLHGSAGSKKLPSFEWLRKCYKLVDRRLRKCLKQLYVVHPTFWVRTLVWLTKPFISSKFYRKLHYVHSLEELERHLPVDCNAIPDCVRNYDRFRNVR